MLSVLTWRQDVSAVNIGVLFLFPQGEKGLLGFARGRQQGLISLLREGLDEPLARRIVRLGGVEITKDF